MEILALTTMINGRKNFISTLVQNRTFDNKKIVNYTINPNGAKDFETAEEADAFIQTIVNPHERVFTPEAVEVDPEMVQSVRQRLVDADIK